ncbi:putative 6-oxopurine nucleoside phosphorylase [Knoellia flava]|uniref:Probable S-methyl-5'-thioinosine phosphorylase n=1 Tax=Knoellia flava TaxID=913969 RepID=A0A8H9FXG4_9MICO|nr:putative 6-oxopurine nucleoside phosphorylase [Knoellia flava]
MTDVSPHPLGIIAGTGFYDLDALDDAQHETVHTAYGTAAVTRGSWHGQSVVFVTRHGAGHDVPPHRINYRAIVRALDELGVHDVVAINVTGGIDPDLEAGEIVCIDDFLDLTRRRESTFHGDGLGGVVHTDMTHAYDPVLRRELLDAASAIGQPVIDGGTYVCFDGPRFESPAEIRLAALAGGTVAGMTGVPEVTLAAEAGLRYAALSLVVNAAAGVRPGEAITMDDINTVLTSAAPKVLAVVDELVHTRSVFRSVDGEEAGG